MDYWRNNRFTFSNLFNHILRGVLKIVNIFQCLTQRFSAFDEIGMEIAGKLPMHNDLSDKYSGEEQGAKR